jgi:hypothetical protein
MTFSASNTIERLCSSGLSQSLCVSKSVPKYPTSSTSATSWSNTRFGLPCNTIHSKHFCTVTDSSGIDSLGLNILSSL